MKRRKIIVDLSKISDRVLIEILVMGLKADKKALARTLKPKKGKRK